MDFFSNLIPNLIYIRYLNEQFYSSTSQDALLFFKKDPAAFKAYHSGYMQQVSQWPVKPLDIIIKQITQL